MTKNEYIFSYVGEIMKSSTYSDFYVWTQALVESAKENKKELINDYCEYYYQSVTNVAYIEELDNVGAVMDYFKELTDEDPADFDDNAVGFSFAFYHVQRLMRYPITLFNYRRFFYLVFSDSYSGQNPCSWDAEGFGADEGPTVACE